ncbi:hypothetical protein MINT15_20820 [Saccharomonospora viridis]|uniref:Uncharacterized protein n=1 Tax=Saccharomonospora viridis TaxID=1852 RepID=A0A837DCI9_9PSEU|nr:hypothetical protein MINT15_20820 [Saccharomonospora viridis]
MSTLPVGPDRPIVWHTRSCAARRVSIFLREPGSGSRGRVVP